MRTKEKHFFENIKILSPQMGSFNLNTISPVIGSYRHHNAEG